MSIILVGVEGSPDSQLALDWAVDEAVRRGSALRLLHVLPSALNPAITRRLEASGRELLAAMAERAARRTPGATVTTELVAAGSPAVALLDRARDADLLVVGSRGMGGFAGLLAGSVSDQCTRHAPCPVVVVPTRGPRRGKRGR